MRLTAGQQPPGVTSVLREAVAGPLTRLLGGDALDRLEVRSEAGGIVFEFGQPLPEVSARALPLLAGIGGVVLHPAGDSAGDAAHLLREARVRLAGVLSRAALDLIAASPRHPSQWTPRPRRRPPWRPRRSSDRCGRTPFRPGARPIDDADRPGPAAARPSAWSAAAPATTTTCCGSCSGWTSSTGPTADTPVPWWDGRTLHYEFT